ncbi:PAW domain-containing protein [Caenorhabditis elegans]|uniref:PAW domain-containing protein n=1 Tax=Caenorhabditis elegans TaxID=6239 RepID=G5EFH6_CAEEL|nr:PAW domain-containing protein [Caenorhabditis elegans]NP_492963.1 PAW domain-containing protein [Caenorhabditis elegans]CAA21046.2 PAW domain-containing protein [Caenorhabditis elegans]CAB03891.2 PAW domain-containing protein [Caenorhabditis elegans]|eukprot:NP_492962.2 Uncharacterized protein CELE_C17D12.3 [Caenorhabditis elegans]
MSSQNPVYSPLPLSGTNISQAEARSHPSKKIVALVLVGTLFFLFSFFLAVALFGGSSTDSDLEPDHQTLTTQNEPIQLGNHRYFAFKYEIVRGKYSHTNKDGSAVKPFIVKNVERHSDEEPYDVYLQKKKRNEEGMIYWKFNLTSTGKVLETLVIRMVGINQTLNGGGKAEACLDTFENCMEIPVNQDLIIDKPQADTLFLGIKMYKNMKVFGHAEKCMECRELESGFLVKAYWAQTHLLNISTTYHQGSGPAFALTPKTGENSAKFKYNFINNSYSHTQPDGSPIRLFNFNGMERVEDYTESDVFLRREIPEKKGNIGWALDLKIDGKSVEKVVIRMIGIEEIANGGGTARACGHYPTIYPKCADIPINGTFTFTNYPLDRLFLDIELDEDIQIFKTKLDDESSVENVSVEVYWKPS